MPRYVYRIACRDFSEERHNYRYLSAENYKEAEKVIRYRFKELAKGHNVLNWDERVFNIEFRRVGERQWLPGPFNAKIDSSEYCPSFDELEDWEDRQMLLFPVNKRKFLVRTCGINESGWRDGFVYEHFRAFSIPEAIDKVKKVYCGINISDNSTGRVPTYKTASFEVKELGKDKGWINLYDSKARELPTASGSPHADKTLRRGKNTVTTYFFNIMG